MATANERSVIPRAAMTADLTWLPRGDLADSGMMIFGHDAGQTHEPRLAPGGSYR